MCGWGGGSSLFGATHLVTISPRLTPAPFHTYTTDRVAHAGADAHLLPRRAPAHAVRPLRVLRPGHVLNHTYETTACLNYPAGQTSLQGAVCCYTPCPPNTALNTTDLTCVPIPQSLQSALAAANLTIDFNTTEVFLVSEPTKLEDTLGAAAAAGNQTVIITLAASTTYLQTQAYVTSNVIILADGSMGDGRRRQLQTVRTDINTLRGAVRFEQDC